MASSSLENKTIRPGSLGAYSYYHSARRPDHPTQPAYIAAARRKLIPWKVVAALLLVAAVAAIPMLNAKGDAKPAAASQTVNSTVSSAKPPASVPAAAVTTAPKGKCAGNSLDRLVIVSISQRHMWACSKGTTAYDSPVITGMTAHASTLTPAGTYHIYAKHTDTVLTGSDVTGSWNDPVHYWMPFLSNRYGIYGFHDATWRSPDEFGKVSPASSDASHGCVELPLATSAWLYGWAPVGTTVSIRN